MIHTWQLEPETCRGIENQPYACDKLDHDFSTTSPIDLWCFILISQMLIVRSHWTQRFVFWASNIFPNQVPVRSHHILKSFCWENPLLGEFAGNIFWSLQQIQVNLKFLLVECMVLSQVRPWTGSARGRAADRFDGLCLRCATPWRARSYVGRPRLWRLSVGLCWFRVSKFESWCPIRGS